MTQDWRCLTLAQPPKSKAAALQKPSAANQFLTQCALGLPISLAADELAWHSSIGSSRSNPQKNSKMFAPGAYDHLLVLVQHKLCCAALLHTAIASYGNSFPRGDCSPLRRWYSVGTTLMKYLKVPDSTSTIRSKPAEHAQHSVLTLNIDVGLVPTDRFLIST